MLASRSVLHLSLCAAPVRPLPPALMSVHCKCIDHSGAGASRTTELTIDLDSFQLSHFPVPLASVVSVSEGAHTPNLLKRLYARLGTKAKVVEAAARCASIFTSSACLDVEFINEDPAAPPGMAGDAQLRERMCFCLLSRCATLSLKPTAHHHVDGASGYSCPGLEVSPRPVAAAAAAAVAGAVAVLLLLLLPLLLTGSRPLTSPTSPGRGPHRARGRVDNPPQRKGEPRPRPEHGGARELGGAGLRSGTSATAPPRPAPPLSPPPSSTATGGKARSSRSWSSIASRSSCAAAPGRCSTTRP